MTQNIFFYLKKNKYDGKRDFKMVWKLIKNFNKITFNDTFMPLVCKIKGHDAYQPDIHNNNEWACKKCHKYIKYNPRKEKLLKLNKIKCYERIWKM